MNNYVSHQDRMAVKPLVRLLNLMMILGIVFLIGTAALILLGTYAGLPHTLIDIWAICLFGILIGATTSEDRFRRRLRPTLDPVLSRARQSVDIELRRRYPPTSFEPSVASLDELNGFVEQARRQVAQEIGLSRHYFNLDKVLIQ
ncbi:hypothetical protein HJC99_06510 [Candidatus Saccharibacteria bacterium]|nr:hypothetical protein [Candidatus Saccharibacteria bacterium]